MKKLVLFFTTMCITLSAWAYHFQVDGIYYTVTSSVSPFTVGVTSGEAKYTGDVSIPATVVYSGVTYSVTAILGGTPKGAFSGCGGLTSITIPSSVTTIGEYAFSYCTGLTSVTIPSSVTEIGRFAFSNCTGLATVTNHSSLVSIGNNAFTGTAWYNNQPDGVVYVGKVAYVYKGTMPANTNIIFAEGTTSVANSAFSNQTNLTSITIPSSVTSIGERAFSGCSGLTSVTIPSSVTEIGNYAFSGCTGLTSVTIPSSVTSIGYRAFNETGWYYKQPAGLVYAGKVAYTYNGTMPDNTNLTIADGTVSISPGAFMDKTGLVSVTIPSSVTSIGHSAFSSCSGLTSVTIPSSVTTIGAYAFYSCNSLSSVNISSTVTSLQDYTFSDCTSLTEVIIPSSVTSIGNSAFSDCISLSSITIPNSVTTIGQAAFYGCSGLTSITIPNTVKKIERSAFEGCSGLSSIFTSSYESFLKSSAVLESLTIYRDTITSEYLSDINKSFRSLRSLDIEGVNNKLLPIEMLLNYYKLENLKLPKNLETIGYRMASDCVLLKEISIPVSVSEIEMRAFENCRSLQKVVFEEGSQLKAIGNWAFYACHALEDIVIPTGVTTIGDGAFWSCDYLKKLSIPSSVSSIGDNAFEGCKTLGSIQVEAATPPQVSGNTFNGVSKSIPVKVPKGSIDQYRTAFGWKDFAYLTETGMDVQQPVSFNCYVEIGTIVIGGVKSESRLVVSDLQGKQLCNRTVNSETTRVELAHRGVYMVSVGGKAVKVLY